MSIEISEGALAAVLWVVLVTTGVSLVSLWALWRDLTRRIDATLGREDIAAIAARRKEIEEKLETEMEDRRPRASGSADCLRNRQVTSPEGGKP